ncbi:MAG: hypothetical protein SFX18_11185 [Pirellulales bacterium]|nr:hypothetical protein [Pirellulales bacterium]
MYLRTKVRATTTLLQLITKSTMPPIPGRKPVIQQLHPLQVQILKEKTPAERLALGFGMWRSARNLVRAAIRHEHPDWSEDQVHAEAAHRLSHGATRNVPLKQH